MMDKNPPAERRSDPRVPLSIPVKLRSQGTEHHAVTRDLSSSGIFLFSDSPLQPGSKIEMVVMCPPGLGLGPGGWTLCEGSVVRVEESGGTGIGVAATLDRIEYVPEIAE
jgi:hypothetical protein